MLSNKTDVASEVFRYLANDLLVLAENSEHQEIPDQRQVLRREVGKSEGTDSLLALDDGLEAEQQIGCEEYVLLPVDAVQVVQVEFGVEGGVELWFPVFGEAVEGDQSAHLVVEGERTKLSSTYAKVA